MQREKLAAYVDWYLKRVIGMRLKLKDSPQPAIDMDGSTIHLPIAEDSLGEFLGEHFVKKASQELLFSVLIGLAYHECAHILSGERLDIEPKAINNLICEANDFTFVPKRWPGSIPYTLTAVNVTYQQMRDLSGFHLETAYDKLSVLFQMAVMFLRKLKIKYQKQEVRTLPQKHPLYKHFEKMKPVLREARRCSVEERPALVQKLHAIFLEFWKEQKQKESMGHALDSAGEDANYRMPLRSEDIAQLEDLIQEREAIRKELEQIEKEIEKEEQFGKGHSHSEESYIIEEETRTGNPPVVDMRLVSEVRQILRPLFFSRVLTRRAASLVGVSFHPSRFYEIKTNPEQPKIRRDVLRFGRQMKESLVILCFDRSGSMVHDSKAKVCQEVAATMYTALIAIPRCDIRLLGFGDKPVIIKGRKMLPLDTVLGRIPIALTPHGGTNLPLALHECLNLAQEVRAYKKLIVMLTDGDLVGTYDTGDVLDRVHHLSVDVFCIGVQGSKIEELIPVFGSNNAVYVAEVQKLGEELKRVVVGRV